MNIAIHDTSCKICNRPMSLEIAEESLDKVKLQNLLAMAVCDWCGLTFLKEFTRFESAAKICDGDVP